MSGSAVRVLYPTDSRPPAAAAGEMLASILDPQKVEVTVFHVEEYGNPAVADTFAAEALGRALERMRSAGFAVQPKRASSPSLLGSVKQPIERELVDGDYGIVVMGIGNTSSLGRLVLGGVSTFVLHRSKVPTVVVQRPPIEGRDHVRLVVGTDGSPAADRAIDTLVAVIPAERSDVFVRSVVELQLPAATGLPGTATLPVGAIERILADQTEDADRYLSEAIERLRRAGFQCDGDVVRGAAEAALLDVVRERDADLVAVGTRGRGRFTEIALGSVSAHLVRTAPATLVAPEPDPTSGGGRIGNESDSTA
jgi:nucleotide-binding universal stress UspA family protein